MTRKLGSPLLRFATDVEDLTGALSAVVRRGEHLWVASDELKSVERLKTSDGGETYGGQQSFDLEKLISLPAEGREKIDQEIDIEGMDVQGSYLWLVGSHSVKRKKVDEKDAAKDAAKDVLKSIGKLSMTEDEGNRHVLARVPLVETGGGPVLVADSKELTQDEPRRRAAQLPCGLSGGALTEAIKGEGDGDADPHLAAFLSVPGKDNGFDVEGLVVTDAGEGADDADKRVFVGLRGPVLRGWAVVLELEVEEKGETELGLKKIGPGGRRYRKHFLQLGGLGVRELCRDGEDLLVLAGPTMNLDGPVCVFRWRAGARGGRESFVFGEDLRHLLTVPHGHGTDHAEGVTLLEGPGAKSLLVVYDSPADERRVGQDAVRADVFELPQEGSGRCGQTEEDA